MEVLEPADAAETAAMVAGAVGTVSHLEVIGGGTKRGLGRPVEAGRAISTRRLDRIRFYEPAELVIGLEPGVPLEALEKTLAAEGQQLAFEPPDLRRLLGSDGTPTIGGTVAANLSGPRRLQAGAARDHLLGFEAVNGRGETFKSGGRVVKNVTGYDLSKLMAGSWGTLGVLTSLTLKVLPRAESSVTLLADVGVREAGALLGRALSSPLEVSGAAWIDGRAALRLEGSARSTRARFEDLAALCAGPPLERLEGDEGRAFWADIRDVAPFAGTAEAVWRISVPPDQGARVLEAAPDGRGFLDWGGGLVWLAVDEAGDCGAEALRSAIASSGGHATLVRASAATRARVDVFQPQPAALAALTDRVKRAFDPLGVLNPGRMYEGV